MSIFFVGYDVPSNLLMQRIGVRKTLTRIMLLWGLISAAMMFVRSPMHFHIARFALGVAEAGFPPAGQQLAIRVAMLDEHRPGRWTS